MGANGSIPCEQHKPIGNLRKTTFREIWHSEEARVLRASISAKECYCTNEIFMWPSITFQPVQLAKAMIGAKVWQKPEPLPVGERADYETGGKVSLPVLQTRS